MMTRAKPFLELTARDLMSTTVVLISQEMPLQGAASLLSRNQISGAPVVDPEGRCVGVLSATDFVRWADQNALHATRVKCEPMCVCSDWQVVDVEALPEDAVRWYMTPDPVIVTPDTGITDLARMMLNTHIHRVIVADNARSPIGIVTSTDILAAVAYLEPEATSAV
jgi:CBS domain-containing protein